MCIQNQSYKVDVAKLCIYYLEKYKIVIAIASSAHKFRTI